MNNQAKLLFTEHKKAGVSASKALEALQALIDARRTALLGFSVTYSVRSLKPHITTTLDSWYWVFAHALSRICLAHTVHTS